MRIVAFMWAYNEADIIGHTVQHLNKEGVEVYTFDDWSTDNTKAIAESSGCEVVEVWPMEDPAEVASWRDMLNHTANTARREARAMGPFWAIHHDADEIRRSPVPGETLAEFFERVRAAGWNAVDHHVEVYAPRDGYDPGIHHPETYFTDRLAGHMDSKNGQIKAWWQTPDVLVDLASSGGHKVAFEGRKVCPEKLLLKHYPMRGAEQRAAKAKSRAERWDPRERQAGWHVSYNS